MVWYNTLLTHHFSYFTYSTQNLNYSEYGAHQYCTTYWHINNTQDIGHLLQLVFYEFLTNLMGSIEFGTSQLNIQDVLEAEWCGLKGSIFYSLYDFLSKTFLILINLFCIIGILPVEPFFLLARFWRTWERLFMNRVRSLLSMRCVLPGYSFESNTPALGTAGSIMTIKSL